MKKIFELKKLLKNLALEIRRMKRDTKEAQRQGQGTEKQYTLFIQRRNCRHLHIAYCLLRGRTYAQIEHPAEDNKPNWEKIRELQEVYREETVCTNP
jgi:hypothetical protein